jgi:hypothetical protein
MGISVQNSNNNLQNQNKQLQAWLAGNESLLNQTQTWLDRNETLLAQTRDNNTSLQNQIDSLNSNNTSLQNQFNNLQISSTRNSEVWVEDENVSESSSGDVVFGAFYLPSAGYVSVRVSSNNNLTYVEPYNFINGIQTELEYNLNPLNTVVVGFGGTDVFSVLSDSMLEITVGNFFGQATQTVTITYYY